MGKYIEWDDAVSRYSIIGDKAGASSVGSNYIGYAEAEVEGKLAPGFSIPFSSNNITVKDLCIDTTLYKTLQFKDTEKAEKILESIDGKIAKLLSGEMAMVSDSGTAINKDNDTAWSGTQNYAPTFGAGNVENFIVSSDRLLDEELARD